MTEFEHEWAAPATDLPVMRPRGPARMLAEFHDALGDERGRGNAMLRMTLHQEEHDELMGELGKLYWQESVGEPFPGEGDVRARLARELADVLYIAYGTAHAFAIDLDVALAEIHRAAMSKLFPPDGGERVVRSDGKVMKPAGFVLPDMTEAIRLGGER
jgi:hypothetical protein